MIHTLKRYPEQRAFFQWLMGLTKENSGATEIFDSSLHCQWIPANVLSTWPETGRYDAPDTPMPVHSISFFITPPVSSCRRIFAALHYAKNPNRAVIVAVSAMQLLVQCRGIVLNNGQHLPAVTHREIAVFGDEKITEVICADDSEALLMQEEFERLPDGTTVSTLSFHASWPDVSPLRVNQHESSRALQASNNAGAGAPPSALGAFGL